MPIDLPYSTAFFPGGTRFVFVAEAADELPRLWVQDVDGGPPQPFGPAETSLQPDDFSGRRVGCGVCGGHGPPRGLLGERRGSAEHQPGKEDSLPIGWFSDNRSVFLRVRVGNKTRIDRLDTASGKRTVWRDLEIQDEAGILRGVFASYISQDGKTIVTSYLRLLNDLYLVRGVK